MTTLTTSVRQPLGLFREAGVPQRPPTAAGISGSDIYRILQQRILLILIVWILGSAATVGTTFVFLRYFPLWTGTAMVRVQSPTPDDPFNPWAGRQDRDTVERFLQSEVARVRDPALLREVLGSPDLKETNWIKAFMTPGGTIDVDSAFQELDKRLNCSPMKGTDLLEVSMPTRDPKDSPRIVNKIVDEYFKRVQNWAKLQFSQDITSFTGERDLKQRELEAIDKDIRDLESEGGIPAMLHGAPTITARLDRLQQELVQKESEMELLRARYRQYSEMGADTAQTNPEILARVEGNSKVLSAVRYIKDLQESKAAALIRLGPQHRDIREIDKRIATAEEDLTQTRQTLLNEERNSLMEGYRVSYFSALQAVAELKESVAESTSMQLDLDRKLRRYDELQRRREANERERDRIAQHLQNLTMVARTAEPARISVFRRAMSPLEPSRPRPILWIPVGIVLSLAVAIGLALALSLLDTSLRTPADVFRHTGVTLLGSVPVLDDEEAAVEEIETASRVAPHSLVAESFRQIRANLLFSAPMEQQRAILVTSASASEGKTCVAINLAVTLAQGGRRILLIDGNFRRPSLHKAFAFSNHTGLSNLLVGQGRLNEFVLHSDLPNLDVLVTGPCPPNPAELLASSYLRTVLTEAVQTYDQVLFDGPPILLVSDASVLAALVDGVILVCRARTSRGMVQRAKTQLAGVNARIIGAVLNAVETTRGGYFRKYYREFYDYQERQPEEVPPSEAVEALPPVRPSEEAASSRGVEVEFKPPEIEERGVDLSPMDSDDATTKPQRRDEDEEFKWPGA
jgi:succinoglycan biosynthesis transport protein ExoP